MKCSVKYQSSILNITNIVYITFLLYLFGEGVKSVKPAFLTQSLALLKASLYSIKSVLNVTNSSLCSFSETLKVVQKPLDAL